MGGLTLSGAVVVMRRPSTVKPAWALVVGPVELRVVIVAGPPAFIPAGRLRSGGPHVPRGGLSSIVRRSVSWGIPVSDSGQGPSTGQGFKDGFERRVMGVQSEGPIV